MYSLLLFVREAVKQQNNTLLYDITPLPNLTLKEETILLEETHICVTELLISNQTVLVTTPSSLCFTANVCSIIILFVK